LFLGRTVIIDLLRGEDDFMSQRKEVVAEWVTGLPDGALGFIGRNASGGTVQMGTMDGVPGISPMELVLVGLAGCTGYDVASILAKKRKGLKKFQVKVSGLRAETYPKVYTEIEVEYLLWGNLDTTSVEQAIELSEKKYCSVSAMLVSSAKIRSSYQILTEETTD
jgi:putative redox protein